MAVSGRFTSSSVAVETIESGFFSCGHENNKDPSEALKEKIEETDAAKMTLVCSSDLEQ